MCINCGYSQDNKPQESPECKVCLRNPKNVSKKLRNLEYKGIKLQSLIDMYISKEHLQLIKKIMDEVYKSGIQIGRQGCRYTYTTSSPWISYFNTSTA